MPWEKTEVLELHETIPSATTRVSVDLTPLRGLEMLLFHGAEGLHVMVARSLPWDAPANGVGPV